MHKILTFKEYLEGEMQYYDEHPEEEEGIEAHTNGSSCLDVDYSTSS
tara:strand:+ start:232 stop:372 length:141 start_codon:yes stop_codon:yes gene_type:complete